MTLDFQQQRIKMVDGQIRTSDVSNHAVLTAFLSVPREAFLPESLHELAYLDEDLPVAGGRFVMSAAPLAKLVQALGVDGGVVLDVGCATGYSSAILAQLADTVVALEQDETLAETAASALSATGCDNATVVKGRLADGYAKEGPYDFVLIGGSVDELPAAFGDQLREGGRLVSVLGNGNAGVATVFVKEGGNLSSRRLFNWAVEPLPGFERAAGFVF
ncbi:MAG: protein-L-isoaspartate O-methyltransferase [Rhizobiaceae bacterium]